MTFFAPAPAKINLFLHVGDRRADGFHALQSFAVFTDMGDVLAAEEAATLSLSLDGPFAGALAADDDNLVLRAARALAARTGFSGGARLALTKNLPVASGIGGGSADAAASLRLLQSLWRVGPDSVLLELAAELGSDIPVCVASTPAFMEGRGEILRPVAATPSLAVLLVNPRVPVSTRDIFGALKDRTGTSTQLPAGHFRDTTDLLRFLETTHNDLEAPARALQPVIGEVLTALAALPGALFARMSGSGATCFAIFPDDESCARGASILQKTNGHWWIAPTSVPEYGLDHEETGRDFGPTDTGL